MKRHSTIRGASAAAALLLAAAAATAASARAPVEEPRLLSNGWHYGEAGNYCMAIRRLDGGARLMMRLAKWDDMSDSLILSAPGLPLLDEEDEAAAARDHDFAVHIDGRPVPLVPGSAFMLAEDADIPGPSYRIGIMQQPFIAALRRGRTLEIRRAGRPLATFPIASSAAMSRTFAACVRKQPSF